MSVLNRTTAGLTLVASAEHPAITCTFRDSTGAIINFSAGYTFTVKVFDSTGTKLTKTTNIAGAATDPNVTINWSDGDLAITPGNYTLQVSALFVADNKERIFQIPLTILPGGA